MQRYFLGRAGAIGLLFATVSAVGCSGANVVVVAPYDADIDTGMQDFKQKLNLLVVEASSKTGADGSFEAYKPRYSELEVQLLLLRQRAIVLEASDTSCDVSEKLKAAVAKLPHGADVLKATATVTPPPVDDKAVVPITTLAIGKQKNLPAAIGCMTHLIDNVAGQLTAIEGTHSDAGQCAAKDQPTLTCIRPAAAPGLLGAANDSLDAALLVEMYKKEGAKSQ